MCLQGLSLNWDLIAYLWTVTKKVNRTVFDSNYNGNNDLTKSIVV